LFKTTDSIRPCRFDESGFRQIKFLTKVDSFVFIYIDNLMAAAGLGLGRARFFEPSQALIEPGRFIRAPILLTVSTSNCSRMASLIV